MKNAEKISDGIMQAFSELEKHAKVVNENLRVYLKGLHKKDLKARIMQMNLSDKNLNFLCEGVALEHGDYEICIAVEEIQKERAQKQRGLHNNAAAT